MQELESMVELLGWMTQADFNQQLSTTAEEAVRARKKRSAREASPGVVTPACTSARNDRGHVDTPSIIPTTKALFTRSPTLSKQLGNTYGEGEADESVRAGDQAPAEEEEEPGWVPRMGADGKRECKMQHKHKHKNGCRRGSTRRSRRRPPPRQPTPSQAQHPGPGPP